MDENGASSGVDDSLLQEMFIHAADLVATDEHPRVQDTTPALPEPVREGEACDEAGRSAAEDGEEGETPPRAEFLPEPERGMGVQAEHALCGQEQEEDDAEELVEKGETFPSQLEAMLNGMLATHHEMHPPFVADEDEADEGSAAPAARQPEVDGELQRDTPNSAEAQESGLAGLEEEQQECQPRQDGGSKEDRSSGDAAAQEAAAVKIQALARGGRDRRRAGQIRGDNAHEHGPEGEESGAGVQDANERPGIRARSQSSEDEGARSSDEEGGHFSDGGDDEAPAVPKKEDATAPDAGTGIYQQQGEDAAVTKIQALARGKRDRQRVRELRDERGAGWEEPQDLNAPGEAIISGSVAPAQASFCKIGQGTEDLDEGIVGASAAGEAGDAEQEEEEERPRLSFAKPIELKKWNGADGQPGGRAEGEQADSDEDEPAPRLTFAAPIHVAAPAPRNEVEEEDPTPKLSFAAPVQKVKSVAESKEASAVNSGDDGGEDEYVGEEKVTFGDKPVQSLDVWMADCADETMDGEEADAEAEGEEEQDGDEQSDVSNDHAGVEVGAENRAPPPPEEKQVALAARVAHVSGAAAHCDSAPALPSPAAASVHSAVAGDRITQGLQTKLKAVEDKVQELQQQLLDQLSGGGGLEEGEDGQEEAVAALNERVEKLIRMRAQIMLALEHQKTLIAARPPSSTRMGTASPRVQQDARILLPHAAATLPTRHQNGYREDTVAMDWPNAHRRGRGGSNSPCEPTDTMRVPPPMKLPKDLSLKPIRGTSKVPPAMFQRNKPPAPASKLFEKYPEEPRGESRELAAPAPIGAIYKPPKKNQHAAYLGGPRVDGTKAGAGSPRAIDYDSYNAQRREEDVKVSFKVLSDHRGSNVANRSHGRAAAIAAQERELQFAKEQDVLKNLVRNQVNLENRYTKEAERAAKLQRINHGDKPAGFSSRHASLFPAGASTKGNL